MMALRVKGIVNTHTHIAKDLDVLIYRCVWQDDTSWKPQITHIHSTSTDAQAHLVKREVEYIKMMDDSAKWKE